tara:strand:+ start:428 stop:631 length:204 start_codon:yes stop_codon:yes gene_type:complete
MNNKIILKWLNNERKKNFLNVKKIDLSELRKWVFNKKEIYHESKKFFKVVGIKIQSNFYKKKIGINQ